MDKKINLTAKGEIDLANAIQTEQPLVVVTHDGETPIIHSQALHFKMEDFIEQTEWTMTERNSQWAPWVAEWMLCFYETPEEVQAVLEKETLSKQNKILIGMCTLIIGTFTAAQRRNAGIKVYVEEPENGLHPNMARNFGIFMGKVVNTFSPKEPETDEE